MKKDSSIPVVFFPGMAGHPCSTLRAISLSLQGEPAYTAKEWSRPARGTSGSGDRFGIPKESLYSSRHTRSLTLTHSLSPPWLLILPHPTQPMGFRGDEAEGAQMHLFDHLFIYLIIYLFIWSFIYLFMLRGLEGTVVMSHFNYFSAACGRAPANGYPQTWFYTSAHPDTNPQSPPDHTHASRHMPTTQL